MADRPLPSPLPADLPEDWTSGQIVAPSGADAGLSQQHGYNYLMAQVNAAQRAANAINESFDTISGKRTCRVTVGASSAGWTQADCDYLCDGTNDEAQLTAAIAAVHAAGGGEIALLSGRYDLPNGLYISDGESRLDLSITGESGVAVLELNNSVSFSGTQAAMSRVRFSGITFHHDSPGVSNISSLYFSEMSATVENCTFYDVGTIWSGGERQQFVFRENMVKATFLVSNFLQVSAYSGQNSAIVSDNTFLVEWGPDSSGSELVYLSIEGSFDEGSGSGAMKDGVVFSGNQVSCDTEDAGVTVHARGGSAVIGNILRFAGIKADVDAVCVGNRVDGGCIAGNGYGQITGNLVSAPAGKSAIDVVKRNSNSVDILPAECTPNITGNTIISGGIGIHLNLADHQGFDQSQSGGLVACNRISGCETSIQIEKNWSGCLITGNMINSAVADKGTGNLVRLNSDDTGSGGGGTAGVASFKGRTGVVAPQAGDYTAEMVGARDGTWTPTAEDVGAVPAGDVSSIRALTQEEYDALAAKDAATLYLIKE